MIRYLYFSKMVASGNDFIVIDIRKHPSIAAINKLAIKICNRKYGIGADGLLILEKSKRANVKVRIFNPDGSEPDMCANGLRCISLWLRSKNIKTETKIIKIETKAGNVEAMVNNDKVKIKMMDPKNMKLKLPIKIGRRSIKVNFINTGVPHAVIFVEKLDEIDVVNIGRQIRFHKRFMPEGTNVDFVEMLDDNNIKLRTYERGVEDETLACGTGSVAAAVITNYQLSIANYKKINVYTKSGEILKVDFRKSNDINFEDVWLEGKAKIVYSGVYYV